MTTDSQIKSQEIRRIENTTESKIMEGKERLRKEKERTEEQAGIITGI